MLVFWTKVLLFVVPIYFANASAMLFGGKTPLDFNKKFLDGKPILGAGKTFKGTISGTIIGLLSVVIIHALFPESTLLVSQNYLLFGFLISLGALVGDIIASFFKRRFGIKRGQPIILLDQLDFVFGGIIFGSIFYVPTIAELVVIVALTVVIHKFTNFVAFKIRLKKVPW